MSRIPFLDLQAQYRSIRSEIDAAIQRVIEQAAFIGGEEVKAFEAEFAAWCGDPNGPQPAALHSASCGNGTDALYLALRALGIGAGHEVITVAHTFIATAEAITLAGAKPVFVDIRPDTYTLDPAAIEPAITPRTRAIVPVHLYGQPCDMTAIVALAKAHRLRVIEDAAQAHGARWQGRRTGGLGDVACFSFYPGKNLGAYGDGGAVVSADADLVRRVRMLANHGRLEKYTHEIEGVNSRLDGLQAAILRVKLRHLDAWNAGRQHVAAELSKNLAGVTGVVTPAVAQGAEPVWHLYVVRVRDRQGFQARLKQRGIATGVHYPLPLHLQPAYAHLGLGQGALPESERAAEEVVSLPIFPEMTAGQVGQVVAAVREAM